MESEVLIVGGKFRKSGIASYRSRRNIKEEIMMFASRVFLVGVTLLATLDLFVHAKNYGKVTCNKKTPVPSIQLLGTFMSAKCTLPTKFPISDEDAGKITRCVFNHIKCFGPPVKLDVLLKVLKTVFPEKYHAGMVKKITACHKANGGKCKAEAQDKAGTSFAPMYNCFAKWFSDDMCAQE